MSEASRERLSQKSRAVLLLIAEGHSYSQIVESHPGIVYPDIFRAAGEALGLLDAGSSDYEKRLTKIKAMHSRAYEPWGDEEDEELRLLHAGGSAVEDIACHLGRQPTAIRSRLKKLRLS